MTSDKICSSVFSRMLTPAVCRKLQTTRYVAFVAPTSFCNLWHFLHWELLLSSRQRYFFFLFVQDNCCYVKSITLCCWTAQSFLEVMNIWSQEWLWTFNTSIDTVNQCKILTGFVNMHGPYDVHLSVLHQLEALDIPVLIGIGVTCCAFWQRIFLYWLVCLCTAFVWAIWFPTKKPINNQ